MLGIFIPAIAYGKIQGLRINLDKKYSLDTTDIWFSSSNQYNGTKASNWPIILNSISNPIEFYNSKSDGIDLIIASEIILAHKLFNITNEFVIGLPNIIEKRLLLEITNNININKVILVLDHYTICHMGTAFYSKVVNTLEELGYIVEIEYVLNDESLISKFNNDLGRRIA